MWSRSWLYHTTLIFFFVCFLSFLVQCEWSPPVYTVKPSSRIPQRAKRYAPHPAYEKIYDPKIGPQGMPYNKTTSCKDFAKNARFNPNSILRSAWFVFYYWAPHKGLMVYEFTVPTKKEMEVLHHHLNEYMPSNFNWSARMLLMEDLVNNSTSLLVERGDRGQYWLVILKKYEKGETVNYHEMRWKQTSDNKYIGAMTCKRRNAFVMARMKNIPPQRKLQDEASKLGFIGRRGKSYLYQGHEWMPVPEIDEKEFWSLPHNFRTVTGNQKKTNTEYERRK